MWAVLAHKARRWLKIAKEIDWRLPGRPFWGSHVGTESENNKSTVFHIKVNRLRETNTVERKYRHNIACKGIEVI